MNTHLIPLNTPKRQTGAVLVVSLVMLLLLTLISTTAMQTTSLEEKMAGNMRDKDLAFQAAESALKSAEASLDPPALLPIFVNSGTGGFYLDIDPANPNPNTITTEVLKDSFWTSNPVATSTVTSLGTASTPRYIIQKLKAACLIELCSGPPPTPYKITVRATGGSDNAVVILQSIYVPDQP